CHGDDPTTLRSDTTGIGTTYLKYGAAYHPFLRTSLNYQYDVADATKFTITLRKDMDDNGDFTGGTDSTANPTYDSLGTEMQSLINLELEKMRVTLPPSA